MNIYKSNDDKCAAVITTDKDVTSNAAYQMMCQQKSVLFYRICYG